jgi:biotin transport system permease protein
MISLTSPIETRAHRWPAGAKLAALCAATMALFALPDLRMQGVAALICLALFALPGAVFFRAGMASLWRLWPFIAVIVIWHGLTGDLAQGVAIALRVLTAVGFACLVTMTTRLTDLMAVMTWLLAPLRRFGLPTRALELALALVIRFTPVLALKGEALAQSWRARSAKRPSWRIVLPMTLLALDDAEYVAEALKARGGVGPDQSADKKI